MALSLRCGECTFKAITQMADSQSKEFFSDIKNEFKDLGSKVNKMFDEIVRGKEGEAEYRAVADMYEAEGKLVVALDLPGFAKADVNVQLRDNQLIVRGVRTRNVEDSVKTLVRERVFGKFERTFTIPAGVDTSTIKAKFDNGVLSISLQKEIIEVAVEKGEEINID